MKSPRRHVLSTTFPLLALLAPLSACSGSAETPNDDVGDSGGPATTTTVTNTGGPTMGTVTSGGSTMGTVTSGGTATTVTVTSGGPTTTVTVTGGPTTGSSSSGGVTSAGGAGTGGAGTTGSSTGDSSTGGTMIEASFETLKFVIANVQPSCAAADCHGNNEHNALNLQATDQLYTNLITSTSEECDNLPVVSPGAPEQSALVRLLKGPCGELPRMPAGCIENEFENNCVPDEYIAAIEQWIADGAPEQ